MKLKESYYFKRPEELINKLKIRCDMATRDLIKVKEKIINKKKNEFVNVVNKLDALSPLKTLSRGYSYTTNENNKTVNFVNDVKKGEKIHVRVVDGTFDAIVD